VLTRIHVIGSGRVGSAVAARLRERGVAVGADDPELVLLCVPDGAIAPVAADVPIGPWVAHVSGATPLAALEPHDRRFSVHPLQTFTRSRGAEQLDGAWAAVTAETDDAREIGPVSSKPFSIVRRISGSSASGGAPAASNNSDAARCSVTM